MTESLQETYRTSDATVRISFGADKAGALGYYASLVEFIRGVYPPGGTQVLDVGCGNGWSTFAFADAGYEATGIDLNAGAFEPIQNDRCRLVQGSATDIPFPDESFDLVVCYQCLEHIADPKRVLDEMARVCRSGGIIAIVGPNLLSPAAGVLYLARPSSWGSLRLRRHSGMPRRPYGDTVPEIVGFALLRAVQLFVKLLRRSAHFTMREPDRTPPFHADNDACYLCNPTDLLAYFKGLGYRIERRGKPGRPPLSYLFAGGTWVAVRKP